STTSHPSVAAKTGATTRRPKPRPITPTPTVAVVAIGPLLARRPPRLPGERTPERPLSAPVTGRARGASTLLVVLARRADGPPIEFGWVVSNGREGCRPAGALDARARGARPSRPAYPPTVPDPTASRGGAAEHP